MESTVHRVRNNIFPFEGEVERATHTDNCVSFIAENGIYSPVTVSTSDQAVMRISFAAARSNLLIDAVGIM